MVFVPTAPSQPPSPEAQEIARVVEDVIVRYQDEHPRTTQVDIQQALQLALSRSGQRPKAAPAIIAAALGVSVMIGLLTLFASQGGEVQWIAVAMIGIMVIAVVPMIFLFKQQ